MRTSLVLALAALMVGAAVVASAALRDDGEPVVDLTAPAPVQPPVVMVRSGRSVAPAWVGRARKVAGVSDVLFVRRGQALLRVARGAEGRSVQRVRRGYAIPIDTLVADTASYAPMLPRVPRATVSRLRPGEAVLSQTAALVRGVDAGAVLGFAGGVRVRVAGIVEDGALNGAEMLVGRPFRGMHLRAGLLLVRVSGAGVQTLLHDEFSGDPDYGQAIWRGHPYGTERAPIVQPGELKQRFGEFAVKLPFGRDWVRLDPAWVRRNIVRARVPILGRIRCHHDMVPRLRRAFGELERRGLARAVDRRDFAGCYAPRRIPTTGALSLHARGMAVDLNAARNPEGAKSRQDPRLVAAMERQGLTWGGAWPTVPDAMHFEMQGANPRP